MDFSSLDIIDEFFGTGDSSSPLMTLIWILPIILFVFYGQRIQLIITSGDIKKKLAKLDEMRNDSRDELLGYIKKNLTSTGNPIQKIDRFLDYFTIMPVDIDPNGIVPKIHHLVRSREDTTRKQISSLFSEIDTMELSKVQNIFGDSCYPTAFPQGCKAPVFNGKKTKQLPNDSAVTDDIAFYHGTG